MPIDLPAGDWTPLLIGDQWPRALVLDAMSSGATARRRIAATFEEFADSLQDNSVRNLGTLDGITAEDTRAVFDRGVFNARRIADVNGAKSWGYSHTHSHVAEFRRVLANLAEDGNEKIDAINNSKLPLPEKIIGIVNIVSATRALVFHASASCAGQIESAIQAVLTTQGIDKSAQQFAAEKGVRPLRRTTEDVEELKVLIGDKLARPNNEDKVTGHGSAPSSIGTTAGGDAASPRTNEVRASATSVNADLAGGGSPTLASPTRPDPGASPGLTAGATTPTPTTSPSADLTAGATTPTPTTSPSAGLTAAGATTPTPTTSPAANLSAATASAQTASASRIDTAPTSTAPTAASPALSETPGRAVPQGPAPLTPTDLAQSFNAGNQTGAPVSASVEAITTAAASPVHTPPPPLNTPLTETAAPATPIFGPAHAGPTPIPDTAHVAHAPTEVAQAVVAPTPAAAIATTLAPPPLGPGPGPVAMTPSTPPSSLLAYGADIRPPAAAMPATPQMAPAAAPGSAPVNPTSGSGPAGQPPVVRQAPVPAAQAGLTERAFAATASGAAAGAAAANAAAESRLLRLLEAVARQQPQLNWAIGDLEDGSTLLTTDLALGWIPPGIEIPAGVRLLHPGVRTGGLEALLGATRASAVYRPGQYLKSAKDVEPVTMSIRARDTVPVDDLGWELAQATKWRDGLPRLAHTLAKAASTRTGLLDSEAELLRDHLATVARTVLAMFPETIDPAQVGNWQLLATIDALISDERTLANYHFVWFQAHALTREGHR